ncbi:purine nucleoside phosphorylase LACC1 [Genypterus blacodes]|uniref:purine nucleoside phosphorylase LACC1 n=1 Tax=Genypterus blacodes TaxID=154954 RepID=UPI003F75D582
MSGALLVDLIHLCPSCGSVEETLRSEELSAPHVFLLCGDQHPDRHGPLTGAGTGTARVLDSSTLAECLYRLKQAVDELDLSLVRVLTSPRGRDALRGYQERLFTAVYSFTYALTSHDYLTCPSCASPAPSDPAHEGIQREVSTFLQGLPALRGEIRVLHSTLIPDCFGHGFSARTGGVSYIPTLSSLNLFSSCRRRDPKATVEENKRRLAVCAGFYPRPLRLVKVAHASRVWVLGKAEPESYDAVVTNRPGVVLAAPGADCMPILFADPVSKVIGAAHAGWKGTLMGVAMATLGAMVREFGCRASEVAVAVGPSVGACCFTLEREQALEFQQIHPDCCPDPHADRPHVNIRLATRILLQRGGVLPEHIHDDLVTDRPSVTPCTSCHPEAFFSHVRDGPNFGTQVGFLWIRETEECVK